MTDKLSPDAKRGFILVGLVLVTGVAMGACTVRLVEAIGRCVG